MIVDTSKNTPPVVEFRELSADEIEAISGAGVISFLKRVAKAVKSVFSGDGDVRRPTDRPKAPALPPS